VLAALLTCGTAAAARIYSDPAGDARLGPDVRSVTVSNTSADVIFRVRFATSPPLRVGARQGWIDMLLLGIDVPPLGPRPIPDGDWLGAEFAAGFHGPATTGMLVRLQTGSPKLVARFRVVTRARTVTFSIPRRALGSPTWFAFEMAAAREWSVEGTEPSGAKADFVPTRGTLRYTLTS
jgi:hypothetical protein